MPDNNHAPMTLDAYFSRIGYTGSKRLDINTLTAVHRAHLTGISYENLDIHLGRRLNLDMAQIYDKIVRRGRGGWCYEMNSLLAWALQQMGFAVTVLGAAVGVQTVEDRQHLDHMALLVTLDESWLLDAGFGNAFLDPLPLREGVYQQAFHTYQLQRDGEYWCFKNQVYGGAGFDFLLQPRAIEEFGSRCAWLQTSPESGFVKTTVCHRLLPDYTILSLRGAVLTTINGGGQTQQVVDSLDDYHDALTGLFSLALHSDEIVQLWEKVWPAHLAWAQQAG